MAITSTVNVVGSIVGTPYGTFNIGPLTITNTVLLTPQDTMFTLSSNVTNFNTADPNCAGIIFNFLGSGNAAPVALVGNAGDTGIPLGTLPFIMLTWPGATPPTTLGFNVTGGPTAILQRIIF